MALKHIVVYFGKEHFLTSGICLDDNSGDSFFLTWLFLFITSTLNLMALTVITLLIFAGKATFWQETAGEK